MKNGVFYRPAVLQVLDDDSLEQVRRDPVIPDSFGIHDHDWSARAYTETGRFAAFNPPRSEEKIFALQKLGEQRINLTTPAIG
jgi:hypothetical protein